MCAADASVAKFASYSLRLERWTLLLGARRIWQYLLSVWESLVLFALEIWTSLLRVCIWQSLVQCPGVACCMTCNAMDADGQAIVFWAPVSDTGAGRGADARSWTPRRQATCSIQLVSVCGQTHPSKTRPKHQQKTKTKNKNNNNLETFRFLPRGAATPLRGVESCSLCPVSGQHQTQLSLPFVIRTPHLHGAPTTEETTAGKHDEQRKRKNESGGHPQMGHP